MPSNIDGKGLCCRAPTVQTKIDGAAAAAHPRVIPTAPPSRLFGMFVTKQSAYPAARRPSLHELRLKLFRQLVAVLGRERLLEIVHDLSVSARDFLPKLACLRGPDTTQRYRSNLVLVPPPAWTISQNRPAPWHTSPRASAPASPTLAVGISSTNLGERSIVLGKLGSRAGIFNGRIGGVATLSESHLMDCNSLLLSRHRTKHKNCFTTKLCSRGRPRRSEALCSSVQRGWVHVVP